MPPVPDTGHPDTAGPVPDGAVTIVTFDWVPDFPRGLVRDIRARWAAVEAGIPYRVETVPSSPKSSEHRRMQPFQQVPILHDGDLTLFESGAIVLHLARGTPLLPEGRRAEITQWLIAALNSLEVQTGRWALMVLTERMPGAFGPPSPPEVVDFAHQVMVEHLDALERVMQDRDWIVGDFSAADIMLVDVLRVPHLLGALSGHPVLTDYVARATARPGFQKALSDHMAHWQDADARIAADACGTRGPVPCGIGPRLNPPPQTFRGKPLAANLSPQHLGLFPVFR